MKITKKRENLIFISGMIIFIIINACRSFDDIKKGFNDGFSAANKTELSK